MRSVSLLDPTSIPFARMPVRCLSSGGTPYQRWVPYGMPQLGKHKVLLDTVFFLYPSEEHAAKGICYGGTGFFVAVPSRRWPDHYRHIHGITNWHVACQQGASAIRVNRCDGTAPDVFAFGPDDWIFEPAGNDIAISPPIGLQANIHKATAIGIQMLVGEEEERDADISAGDDVFMVGRFVDYDGAETNAPSCRFGNISIASANIKQPTNHFGRSIVVDMHSRTGYSGSPVFVYRTPGSIFFDKAPEGRLRFLQPGTYLGLLGIHWGQFPEVWNLKQRKPGMTQAAEASLITDGGYVEGLSGMTCVIPASAILRLVQNPQLEAMREAVERDVEPWMNSQPLPPVPEDD